jgi:hypothetical protein
MPIIKKIQNCAHWLPAYAGQRLTGKGRQRGSVHLIFCVADHFEPAILPGQGRKRAERNVQQERLEVWFREIPKAVREYRDAEGFPFRHTYFYPAEQYDPELVQGIAEHCHDGWGEIEIHLHHGAAGPDTADNTRNVLVQFRDALVSHGCLSQFQGKGGVRYAFVHGNFALANSAGNLYCGVDEEMQILSETGCFGDFTLPSAPNVSQTAKINSLYECALPLNRRAPHRKGRNLQVGHEPQTFPLIIQGPLMWDFSRRKNGIPVPAVENGELTTLRPPTMERLQLWRSAGIRVKGRPDWIFIKLHCHGMDPRDTEAMHGAPLRTFLRQLFEGRDVGKYAAHFTTAREMTNIILAACDGKTGNPGEYRDYRLVPVRNRARLETDQHVVSAAERTE